MHNLTTQQDIISFIEDLTTLAGTMDFSERPGWRVISAHRIPFWAATLCLKLDVQPRKDDTIKIATTQYGQQDFNPVPHDGLRIMQCPFDAHRHLSHHRICRTIHCVERSCALYVFLASAGTINDDTGEMIDQLVIKYDPSENGGRLLLGKSKRALDLQDCTPDYLVEVLKPCGAAEQVLERGMVHVDIWDRLVFDDNIVICIEEVTIDFDSIGGLAAFVVKFVGDLIFWSPVLLLWKAGFAPNNLELCTIYAIVIGIIAWEKYGHWKSLVVALAIRACLFLVRL